MQIRLLTALAAVTTLTPVFSAQPEWDRFRGPNGGGVVTGVQFPVSASDSDFAWRTDLPGIGHGSPAIWGEKVFVVSGDPKSGMRMPMGIDLSTGAIAWSHKVEAGKFKGHRFNSPASTTPAVDADAVFFTWATKESLTVSAYTHEGEPLWEVDLGPVVGGHGFGASPMIFEDLLVLNNDQEKENGFLIALDRKTGKTAWEVKRHSARISYSTPVVYPNPTTGKPLLVFTNWTHGFTAIDPKDGSVVAESNPFNTQVNERAISSPIVWKDLVIGTCGFTNNPKHCVAMRLNAKGDFEEVWRIEKSVPHIPSVILVHDLLYLWDDNGMVTCVEPATGESLWRERADTQGQTFGSPVSDGAAIFALDQSGNLNSIAASRDYKSLGRTALEDTCRSTPAIAGDKLIVRTESQIFAIQGAPKVP